LKLLLDAMLSPAIARELRRRGHDVPSAVEREDVRGLADEALLEFARTERRVLVTRDVGDFSRLELQLAAEEQTHQGIIFVSPRRFPASARAIGALVRSLEAILEAHDGDDDLVDSRMWLEA
jgi:uncharacterized protein with PIN domain